MAIIQVNILNQHQLSHSHIEVLLKDITNEVVEESAPYYFMNRWSLIEPAIDWETWHNDYAESFLRSASSVYTFEIEVNDPKEICEAWHQYWTDAQKSSRVLGILGKNCAVSVQWFLTRFAKVPEPNLSNVSWNYAGFGLLWPSFLPIPVTLPGRVMSNAKFYIEARETAKNPDKARTKQHSRLFLYTSMSLSTLAFAGSVFALTLALNILSGGLAALAIGGCVVVGLASTYCFFKARNYLSAKNIIEKHQKRAQVSPGEP